jgi:hypothetical protein
LGFIPRGLSVGFILQEIKFFEDARIRLLFSRLKGYGSCQTRKIKKKKQKAVGLDR